MKLFLFRDRRAGEVYYISWTNTAYPSWNPWILIEGRGRYSYQSLKFKKL